MSFEDDVAAIAAEHGLAVAAEYVALYAQRQINADYTTKD